MRRLPLLCLLCLVPALACSKKKGGGELPELTAEDKAGEVIAVGAKVKAPLGKRKKTHATVTEVYGKVAKLKFTDNVGWALLKDLEPVGAIQAHPTGDTCAFSVGDEVMARWSTALTLTAGTIDEVYGKLAHIQFVDNDVDWAVCDELKPKADDEGGAHEGGGVSPEVRHCMNGCNHQCHGASNKSKCVAQCRRACRG